jgi:DNA-binding transcriptional ArsR family regulator
MMNRIKLTDNSIVEKQADVYKVFTNGKRIEIINILGAGEKTVTELAALLRASKGNVSQHLAIMRYKGILATRRDGVCVYYRVANMKVIEACFFMKEALFENDGRGKEAAVHRRLANE